MFGGVINKKVSCLWKFTQNTRFHLKLSRIWEDPWLHVTLPSWCLMKNPRICSYREGRLTPAPIEIAVRFSLPPQFVSERFISIGIDKRSHWCDETFNTSLCSQLQLPFLLIASEKAPRPSAREKQNNEPNADNWERNLHVINLFECGKRNRKTVHSPLIDADVLRRREGNDDVPRRANSR